MFGSLLIERNHHYCCEKDVNTFKKLLRKNEIYMLQNNKLNFDITNEIKMQSEILEFI
jgi:hypothetical protein